MLGWMIAIVIVLLVLMLPVGVSAAYDDSGFLLRLKIGVLGIRLFPRREKRKPRRERGAEASGAPQTAKKPKKPKPKLKLRDIRDLLQIVLRALHRLRVHLSVDVLQLYITVAADDPFAAVRFYGAVNAGLGIALAELHKVLKIRDEDVAADIDLDAQQLRITAKVAATLQIWEILLIGICAGAALLVWHFRRKKQAKAEGGTTKGKELE